MTPNEIREAYMAFFEKRAHTRVSSASLVPENDPSLLFTGAGMNQFKDEFLGKGRRGLTRAASSQKCLRTGDLENVGRTPGHHSFFEMLGNFSFGDYFKREAIEWAWEFVTEIVRIDPERLSVSVYEDDEEAFGIWRDVVGLPASRIHRFGAKSNFWPANAPADGPNGPCGPCSEIFFDYGPEFSKRADPDSGDPENDGDRYVEIWNLVFTQFDRRDGGELVPLPQRNIDTGAGFERMVAVIEGAYRTLETDLFRPLTEGIARVAGRDAYTSDGEDGVRCRRIADHVRAACFLVGDGVRPGNEGRGYVLRRVLRRAIRDGFGLGIQEPFLKLLVAHVVDAMGEAYPDLVQGRELLESVLHAEEALFRRTFRNGMRRLEGEVERVLEAGGKEVAADAVFQLHDTFGFPVDVTAEILAERGLEFDRSRYDELMEEQRERARGAQKMSAEIFERGPLGELAESGVAATEFVGYGRTEEDGCGTRVEAVAVGMIRGDALVASLEPGDEAVLVLDRTPFYSEAGGQVGDHGQVRFPAGVFHVTDTQAQEGYWLHTGRYEGEGPVRAGESCTAQVDRERRDAIRRNHTATHLLHRALKDLLGDGVQQAGSMVAPDRLRFDFTLERALTDAEIRGLEDAVTAEILRNAPLETELLPVQQAKKKAVALFGEKYPDPVRVVSVGSYSAELCGGTHCLAAGDIGGIRITSESSIAAGIRRVEAVTGRESLRAMQHDRGVVSSLARRLGVPTSDIEARVEKMADDVKLLRKQVKAGAASHTPAFDPVVGEPVRAPMGDGELAVYVHLLEVPREEIAAAGEALAKRAGEPVAALLVTTGGGKVAAVVAGNPAARELGFDAPTFIRALGGRGGGKPHLAQGTVPGKATIDGLREAVTGALLP